MTFVVEVAPGSVVILLLVGYIFAVDTPWSWFDVVVVLPLFAEVVVVPVVVLCLWQVLV